MDIQIVETINRFEALATDLERRNHRALTKGVNTCVKEADKITPVKSGDLKGNKTKIINAESATITWNQHYAAYQELGTRRGVPARHFAQKGMDAALPVIEAELNGFGGH